MYKAILDRFILVMINLVKSLEWVGFYKEKKWKLMAIKGGKACSRSKERYNFNGVVRW